MIMYISKSTFKLTNVNQLWLPKKQLTTFIYVNYTTFHH